jgi:C1A family cysteine protease
MLHAWAYTKHLNVQPAAGSIAVLWQAVHASCIAYGLPSLQCSALQDQNSCGACVGFAVTAAAEAAINVHLGQNWNRLNLSEQDLSFCRYGLNLSINSHEWVVCEGLM